MHFHRFHSWILFNKFFKVCLKCLGKLKYHPGKLKVCLVVWLGRVALYSYLEHCTEIQRHKDVVYYIVCFERHVAMTSAASFTELFLFVGYGGRGGFQGGMRGPPPMGRGGPGGYGRGGPPPGMMRGGKYSLHIHTCCKRT